MFQYAFVTAPVFRGRICSSLRAAIIGGMAAAVLGLFSPWCANAQEGAKNGSLAADAARCLHDCCFPQSIELGGEALVLRGISTFRYWGLRVYTGALYAPPAAQSRDTLRGEIRKKLELCYHRSLSPEQFQEKSQEVLEDTPGMDLATLEPHLSAFNKAYVAVKEGDRYAITYDPTSGTMKLFVNDREKEVVTIQSPSFAQAYFGIWLSEYSVGKQFTAELFGEKVAEE